MTLERFDYRQANPLFLQTESPYRPRPPFRKDIPINLGVDFISELGDLGYRYEDAVLEEMISLFGGFWAGPHVLDWIFTPYEARLELKKKGNADGWRFKRSDPGNWVLTAMVESSYSIGDIEARSKAKYDRFKHIRNLERSRSLPRLFKQALPEPEFEVPDRIEIPPFERILKVYVSPDTQSGQFFKKPDVIHQPLSREAVHRLAA